MDEILEYEGLVYSIINKYNGYVDRDDLYQVGMMGLINAQQHFDKSVGIKFSTYAYYYVIGEVTKYIRENRCIKVSREVVKTSQAIDRCQEVMRQRLGREPTDTELSLFMEIDEERISEVREAMQEVKSLDFENDDDNALYDVLGTSDNRDQVIDLKDAINRLSDEEKQLLEVRYYQDMTQSEASKQLGMSQVQVSRREGKILEKLRQKL